MQGRVAPRRANCLATLGLACLACGPAAAQTTTLAVTNVADAAAVTVGDAAGFTIAVINQGGATATGVTLSDPLPGGLTWSDNSASCSISTGTLSCAFGSIPVGGSASVHVTATTKSSNCSAPLVNIATASAANASQAANAAVVTVLCPSLSLHVTPDASVLRPGRTIGVTIGLRNDGLGKAKSVSVTAHLPKMNGLAWTKDSDRLSCSQTDQSEAVLVSCFAFPELDAHEGRSTHYSSVSTLASFFGDSSVQPFDATATASNDANAGAQLGPLAFPLRYSGDVDGNKAIDVADVFFLINFLFAGGASPP